MTTAQNHKVYGPDNRRTCGRCVWHTCGVSGDGSAGTQDHWCRAVSRIDGQWVFNGVPPDGAKHIDELHHTQTPDVPEWCPCVSIPVTEEQVEFAEKLPTVECDKTHLRLMKQNVMLRAGLKPPNGYDSWLEYAIATMDCRTLHIESCAGESAWGRSVQGEEMRAEAMNEMCSLTYYHTAATQSKTQALPKYVPCRVRVSRTVHGDRPFVEIYVAPGEYDCRCNAYGAVSVVASDGKELGLRLDEFEPIAWVKNLKAM